MAQAYDDKSTATVSKWKVAVWITAGALLLLPLVAMQFTRAVDWTGSDFTVAAVMLFGSLGLFELLTWRAIRGSRRVAIGAMLLGACLLTWVNAAVGIIGSEHDPINLIFFAAAAATVVGAILLSVTAPRR